MIERVEGLRQRERVLRDHRQLELSHGVVDGVVETARKSLEITTAFVRDRDLMTLPPDPLEIIVMPEFQRGVSTAYCDSPGPLGAAMATVEATRRGPALLRRTRQRGGAPHDLRRYHAPRRAE